jgi:hypothetical protein
MSSAFGEPTQWAVHPEHGCEHKNTRRNQKYSTGLDCNHSAPLMQRCAFCSKPFKIPNAVWVCHVEDNFCCVYGEEIATIWTTRKEFRECIWTWDYKLLGIAENLWFGPFVLTYDPVINWAIFWNHPKGWQHPVSIPTWLMDALDQIGRGQFRQTLKTLLTRKELAVASSSIERTV